MKYLSQWASVPVSDTAVSTRGKLIMSIVLDRSGSMSTDGGGTALQAAVPLFVNDFNNTTDEVAMISFSDNATVDFPINYNFKTPITNAVSSHDFRRRHIRHGCRHQIDPKHYYGSATLARPITKRQHYRTTGAEHSQSCRVFH